jgi:prepilin peptidase CpaA
VSVRSVAGGVGWSLLVVLLTVACASDWRTRRIPNEVVVALAVCGVILAMVSKSWVAGLTHAGAGGAVGLAIWLPFYALRTLGAGDVKLFAAASTFLGPHAAVEGALYTALYGGVIAFVFMIIQSGWTSTLLRVSHSIQQPALLRNEPTSRLRRLPYAFAITAGVLTAAWWPGHILT